MAREECKTDPPLPPAYAELKQKYEELQREHNQLVQDMHDPEKLLQQLLRIWHNTMQTQAEQAERMKKIEADMEELKASKKTQTTNYTSYRDLAALDQGAFVSMSTNEGGTDTVTLCRHTHCSAPLVNKTGVSPAVRDVKSKVDSRLEACKAYVDGEGYGVEDDVADLY